MSIRQGLISPPLSGRTSKENQPQVEHMHKFVDAADRFGFPSSDAGSAYQPTLAQLDHFSQHHIVYSPVKSHGGNLSDAERALRPPTPPMSKDVRHDQHERDDHDARQRADSEGEQCDAPALSSSMAVCVAQSDGYEAAQESLLRAPASSSRLMAAAPIRNCFKTLNQAIESESDDEHNPFLDNRSTAASSSFEVPRHAGADPAHAHHAHPYYDEFDSDQDAEGSVEADGLDRDLLHDATPRASSSNATTPPPRVTQALTYRPARPFSERVRVDNESVASIMPIRDTPKNPFLEGGPADNGFTGPNRHQAYRRAKQIPAKERGKIAYVFRGQRVIYADPEYDSDDDDSELEEERAKTNEFNPHHNAERPPRLQPRLLFPPPMSMSQPLASTSRIRSHAPVQHIRSQQMDRRRVDAPTAYVPRAGNSTEKESGDTGGSSGYDEELGHAARRTGGGLFAAQIAAQRKQANSRSSSEAFAQPSAVPAPASAYTGSRDCGEATAPSSSARLQSVTHNRHDSVVGAGRQQAARDALLARLDQTNWSDDEDDEDRNKDEYGCRYGHRRDQRGVDATAADEEEPYQAQKQLLPQSQSQKRPSDELQPGHAEEVDVLGRPMKRSRASYAY